MNANFNYPISLARTAATSLILVTLLGAGPALAADMVEAAPEPAPVIEELPVASWFGPYVGVQGGYALNNSEIERSDDIDADGAVGGAFAGFNFQTGSLVYGVEGDVGYSGAEDENDDNTFGTQDGIEGSLRTRLGYAVTDNVLLYGTAGGVAKQMTVAEGDSSEKKGLIGYTVGAGTDIKITEKVFGRAEYRFNDYGSEDFELSGGSTEVDSQDHRIQFGIGMQF